MKTIVTHISPDMDAIASAWLLKRYLPSWESADLAFVPAGETYQNARPDSDPDIIHVDTGLGNFDHHQLSQRTSATKRVFDYLEQKGHINNKDCEAVRQMVIFTTEIDNFGEVNFHDPTDIKYAFCLHEFIYPLRGMLTSDVELMNITFLILDSILSAVKNYISAEKDIKNGAIINTRWGKTLVIETHNEAAIKYALKKKFQMVVKRDPEKHIIRIKTQPDPNLNLSLLYEKLIKLDSKATWFLHASKNMLLNGSSKNPKSIPSRLTIAKMIEILKEI